MIEKLPKITKNEEKDPYLKDNDNFTLGKILVS